MAEHLEVSIQEVSLMVVDGIDERMSTDQIALQIAHTKGFIEALEKVLALNLGEDIDE